MNKENKTRPPKKGIPGGFLLIFFSLLVLFFMSQQSSSHRSNQVSFSYQAEHLVNLDLLQPDSGGSKIAPKDNNLVSFSGQFRDRLTEEGRARFKYLEFLNRNHELRTDESLCLADLDKEQKEVVSAATLFLQLTGASVPREGYCVISPALNTANRNNEVVIHNIPPFPLKNLKDFKAEYLAGETSNTQLAQDLLSLVQAFRSSALGIGEESLKNLLKEIENNLQSAISASSATLFSIILISRYVVSYVLKSLLVLLPRLQTWLCLHQA